MVNPVSSVRFGNAAAPAVNPLEREGAFTKPKTEVAPATTKKSSGGKKLLKFLGAAAAVAATLVVLAKTGMVKPLETTEGAKLLQKAGHYLAKAGEAIAKYTWNPIAKFFSKGS